MSDLSAISPAPLRKRESHIYEREADNWYVEPAWCSERLFATQPALFRAGIDVLDPACGGGSIVDAAERAGMTGWGVDIAPRWEARPKHRGEFAVGDFFGCPPPWNAELRPDAIVCNPPYGAGTNRAPFRFVAGALERAPIVAMLLPTTWAQGEARARWLAGTPLYRVLLLCPRPSMPPGNAIAAGVRPAGGTTDYAWFLWLRGYDGAPQLGWLHRDARVTA